MLLLNTGWFSPIVQAASPYQYAPVNGQITSHFGWRSDPFHGNGRFHAGVDIAAATGTPVYAPQNARVVYSGRYKGYGNVVVLDHGHHLYTLYGHASALYVRAGQAVRRGQAIAAVGSTGRSTGPHLHFEVHQNRQYVDPLNYLAYLGRTHPGQTLAYAVPVSQSSASVFYPSRNKGQTAQGGPVIVTPAYVDSDSGELVRSPLTLIQSKGHEVTLAAADPGVSAPLGHTTEGYHVQIGEGKPPAKPNTAVRRKPRKGAVEMVSGNHVKTVKF